MDYTMKKSYLIALILVICTLPAFSFFGWDYDKTVNGMEFKKVKINKDEDLGEKRSYIKGILAKPHQIQGFPIAADWLHINKNNILLLFRLNDTFEYNSVNLPKNTWVKIKPKGDFTCIFPNDTTIQGYKCNGGGGPKGVHTSFYKSGKLKAFFSDDDVPVGNIKCKGNLFLGIHNIILFENGNLKKCHLAEDTLINGKQYEEGDEIYFDKTGKVIKVE
jgi:hypothetical protein